MLQTASNFMSYVGVHFKTCPIELREAWSLVSDAAAVNECIYKVTKKNLEFVNIGTCNRFDICIFGQISKEQLSKIFYNLALDYFIAHNLDHLIKHSEKILSYIEISFDFEALNRLFKVTASLDSLVLGEQQILGQIKDAYIRCLELGFARKVASQIFSHNFRVAKKIRSETDIGKNSLSVGHAAIEMIHQVFDSFKDKKILIIGAGNMAKLIAKNFYAKEVKCLFIANRTVEKAEKIARELGFVSPMSLFTALEQIHEYDICILAAGGNDFIITKEVLKNYDKKRQGNLSVFIDISVPRKIIPQANNFDNVFLFYIDDLDLVMEKNRHLRKKSALDAQSIIDAEVQAYASVCEQKENLQNIAKMHSWLSQVINYEVGRYLYDVDRGKKSNSNVIADSVAKRVISRTAKLARANAKLDGATNSVGEMLEFLFKFSDQEELDFKKEKSKVNVLPFKKKQSS